VLTTVIAAAGGSSLGPQMGLVSLAWALYYYFALESGDGQTLGKKLMKLRVMRADGGRTGMQEIAVRTVLRVVDGIALYLVGLVVMLVTGKRRQRLGDIAAGTVVVDASSAPAPVTPAAASPTVPDVPATDAPAYAVSTPVDVGSPLPGMTAPEDPGPPTFNPSRPEVAPQPQAPAPDHPAVELVEQPSAEPVEQPSAEPVEHPSAEPVDQPSAEPVQQSPAEPVEQPPLGSVEQPSVEPAADPSEAESPPSPVSSPVDDAPRAASTFNPSRPATSTFNPSRPAAPTPAPGYPPAAQPAAEPVGDDPAVEPVAEGPAGAGAHEPEVEVVPSDDAEGDDDQMTVKSVETVSAMDLIMDDDDDESPPPPARDDGPAGA
jgi:hypothetical protein